MNAYPYDVELKLENKNTKETTLTTRRVYAYNACDAAMQAIYETAGSAGSADMQIIRIGPPAEFCMSHPLEELSKAIRLNSGGIRNTVKDAAK